VLKEQVLESVEQRHADECAYQEALAEWQTATANPEAHPQWAQFFANALRDALRRANNRRQETLMDKSFKDGSINRRSILLHEIGFEQRFVQIVLKI
jgi:hypothetical protein